MTNDPENDPLWEVNQRMVNELQQQQEERRQRAAANPRNAQDPETYEAAARDWALRDKWTIAEAANLLCRCEPLRPSGLPGHLDLDREVNQIKQALLRSELEREGKRDKAQIRAEAILEWAQRKGIEVPEALRQATGLERPNTTEPDAHNASQKRLRPNEIDQELCRAVAQTLWHEYPSMTVAAVVRHPALQRYANGAQYQHETLRGWVKDLDPRPPEQRRGRPRKESDDSSDD
jgi:hypothetical protein